MGQAAAKKGDRIVGTDIHIVMIPSPGGPVPTPLPHPFNGQIDDGLSDDVNIGGQPAAVQGSKASNMPSHIPQGGPFQTAPRDKATIQLGSTTVFINGKPAARNGDPALTCNDPADVPVGTIIAIGSVNIG